MPRRETPALWILGCRTLSDGEHAVEIDREPQLRNDCNSAWRMNSWSSWASDVMIKFDDMTIVRERSEA
jgi:hypothetical protein